MPPAPGHIVTCLALAERLSYFLSSHFSYTSITSKWSQTFYKMKGWGNVQMGTAIFYPRDLIWPLFVRKNQFECQEDKKYEFVIIHNMRHGVHYLSYVALAHRWMPLEFSCESEYITLYKPASIQTCYYKVPIRPLFRSALNTLLWHLS